jgi:hypothetical protein
VTEGWALWSQAGDQVDVARLDAADVRRTVAVATARAYLEVIAQKRLLETAVTERPPSRPQSPCASSATGCHFSHPASRFA